MVAVCVLVFTHSCLCGEKVEVAEPILTPPQLPEPDLTVGLGGFDTVAPSVASSVEVAESVLTSTQLLWLDLEAGFGGNMTLFIYFFYEMVFWLSLLLVLFLLYRIFKLQNEQTKLLIRLSLLEAGQRGEKKTTRLRRKGRRRLSPPLKY